MNPVTCKQCGWVHMAYTREQAEAEVARFNAYYETLSEQQKEDYYGRQNSSIDHYVGCNLCGGTEFRPTIEGDCPTGCTISPVIVDDNIGG